MNELTLLTQEWVPLTDKLLKLEIIDMDYFKSLVQKTHLMILEYSSQHFVPKEMCQLLLELQWFAWWVADLESSPMHGLYQEMGNALFGLINLFFEATEEPEEELPIDSLLSLF